MLNTSLGAYPEHQAPPSPPPGAPGTAATDESYGGDEGGSSEGEQLPPRLVPEEPMYLIISMAVSRQFSFSIDESIFPATLRVGHVRMYQRRDEPRRCSCDPPDHPTAVWLTNHWWAVGLAAPAQVRA